MSKKMYMDIESDNLLDKVTKVHCIATKMNGEKRLWKNHEIRACLEYMDTADELIIHNGISFDIPVLRKLYKWEPKAKVIDTLVMSRVIHPNLYEVDEIRYKQLPINQKGSHSLGAWGRRLGEHKIEYAGGFEVYTEEMGNYCLQDVETLEAVYVYLEAQKLDPRSMQLEHDIAEIVQMQTDSGFGFDKLKAVELYSRLCGERDRMQKEMATVFPDKIIERVSEKTGKPLKTKVVPFNPGSRDMIAQRLMEKYEWKPKKFSPTGKVKIDGEILRSLPYPEAQTLADFFDVQKLVGMIGEGEKAWLALEKDGKIHGSVNTNGAATGRMTHSSPNLAQIPSITEVRELFIPHKGYTQVGVDLSGIELRVLAHFMARWDNGAYAEEVVNGDVHTLNMKAAKLETRAQAKTMVYATLYGSGDSHLAEVLGKTTKEAKEIKQNFFNNLPALKALKEAVITAVQNKGYLTGLDGRKLFSRSPHSALNLLLQGTAAIIFKQWIINIHREAEKRGWVYGKDWHQMALVHDEGQWSVKPNIAEEFSKMAVEQATLTGEQLSLKCKVDAEAKLGANWHECH